MTALDIRGLKKSFVAAGQRVQVLDIAEILLAEGEFVGIFGPNGCGKTTLLNVIAGLATPTSVERFLVNVPIDRLSVVFQDYRRSLLPWWNVGDNISFPLLIDGASKADRLSAVEKLLGAFGVQLDLSARASSLSGGQAQVVAILRALIKKPQLLILDEPFSALDYEATIRWRDSLAEYVARERISVLLVSHDLEESLFLADRTLMLSKRPGRVVDEIRTGFKRPRTSGDLVDPHFQATRHAALEVFQKIVQT